MSDNKPTHLGVINAVSAYTMWGIAPLYFKLITDIAPSEILIHRIIWSFLLLAIIVVLMNKKAEVQQLFRQPKLLLGLTISALFLGCNWFLFIWAINNDHLLDASLGYFINPLFSVALGMIFLGERLKKWQKFAVILAALGVLLQLISFGTLPIISLALAGTFGIYGLLRKKMFIDSFVGLLFESLLMLPIAILYWHFYSFSPTSNMFTNELSLNITLVLAGVVTTAPLLCFTAAAKRLSLSTLGFFQYIGPSIMFLMATLMFGEQLKVEKLVTFIFIWVALVVFSVDSFKKNQQQPTTSS